MVQAERRRKKGQKMRERMDLQSLVPWVKEELEKGRSRKEIYDELHLNTGQRNNINYYIDREKKAEEEIYTFMPYHEKPKRYIVKNGKRYLDITAEFIDCGG